MSKHTGDVETIRVRVLTSAAQDEASTLAAQVLAFLAGGMALRQRHPLTIATLKMCFDGIQRGLWSSAVCSQFVPHLVRGAGLPPLQECAGEIVLPAGCALLCVGKATPP